MLVKINLFLSEESRNHHPRLSHFYSSVLGVLRAFGILGPERKNKAKRALSARSQLALTLPFLIAILCFLVVVGWYYILNWTVDNRPQAPPTQPPDGSIHGGRDQGGREPDIERGDGAGTSIPLGSIPQAERNNHAPTNHSNSPNVQGSTGSEDIQIMPIGRFRSRRKGMAFGPGSKHDTLTDNPKATGICSRQDANNQTHPQAKELAPMNVLQYSKFSRTFVRRTRNLLPVCSLECFLVQL